MGKLEKKNFCDSNNKKNGVLSCFENRSLIVLKKPCGTYCVCVCVCKIRNKTGGNVRFEKEKERERNRKRKEMSASTI